MANRMIFKQEYEGWSSMHGSAPPSTVTMELSGDLSLTDILERFQDFLKGCGYYFDGTLDIVYDEVDEITDDLDNLDIHIDESTVSFGSMDDTISITPANMGATTSISMPEEHSTYYYDYTRNK